MKFIIDENLSPDLLNIFKRHQLQAWHINELKAHKKHRIRDDQLRRLSIQKGVIIVTKDDDFVKSFVDRKVPEKLVFVYDLDQKQALLEQFNVCLPEIVKYLKTNDFIEINRHELKFPFG